MSSNGGCKNIPLKKSVSNFKIIGDTPEITEDLKNTINYLENIVINKSTLPNINTTELVTNINKLIQSVEVLSAYKEPIMKLLKYYEEVSQKCLNPYIPPQTIKKFELKKKILEEIISNTELDKLKIRRKEYWEKYE